MIPQGRWPRVLVYGAGSVGCTFGGFLSKHADVTLLGRASRLNAIRENGLRISGIWGEHFFERLNIATEEHSLSGKCFDLVLVTVKAYDTAPAAKALRKIVGPKTLLLSLQNGLGNPEALHRYFPKQQVLAGRVIFGAKMPEPGHVTITVMAEPTAIGETSVSTLTPRVKSLAAWVNRAGVPSVPCADIQSVQWAKVIYNCALNPLASLLACYYGALTEKPATRNVMNTVIEEIYAVAKKKKIKLNPRSAGKYKKLFYSRLVARTYHHHPSMLQDLQRRRRTEIDALNGAIAALGKKTGIETPVNALLADMIREREAEFQ